MKKDIKCNWCGGKTGLQTRERNNRTYENSDIYVECPYCGRGDMCSIAHCTTYTPNQISERRERKHSCKKSYCQQKQQIWEKEHQRLQEKQENLRNKEKELEETYFTVISYTIEEIKDSNNTDILTGLENDNGNELTIEEAIEQLITDRGKQNQLRQRLADRKQELLKGVKNQAELARIQKEMFNLCKEFIDQGIGLFGSEKFMSLYNKLTDQQREELDAYEKQIENSRESEIKPQSNQQRSQQPNQNPDYQNNNGDSPTEPNNNNFPGWILLLLLGSLVFIISLIYFRKKEKESS